jgi:hypothetical protein
MLPKLSLAVALSLLLSLKGPYYLYSSYFIGAPSSILVVAYGFLAAYLLSLTIRAGTNELEIIKTVKKGYWILLVTSIAWFILAALEQSAMKSLDNIRLDLLFAWPLTMFLSIFCICSVVLDALGFVRRADFRKH